MAAARKPEGLHHHPMSPTKLVLVIIVDGLRPDSITAADTPNLERLRREGAECTAGHAVLPPVTRVNAAAMATGFHPAATGITGNFMYVPVVDPHRAFATSDATNLYRLGDVTGRISQCKTLAEHLVENDRRFIAIGSGSSGCTLCLNPMAPQGVAFMINGDDPAGGAPFTFPISLGEALRDRFGSPPAKGLTKNASVDYVVRVLTDYVLPDLGVDAAMIWLAEPDASQHSYGIGSPQAQAAIHNVDRSIGMLLDHLEHSRLIDETSIILVSDHGHSLASAKIDLGKELVLAGLKQAMDSNDVVVCRNGSASLFVQHREYVGRIVEHLQQQEWVDTVFTAQQQDGGPEGMARGRVEGTFSLSCLGLGEGGRSPDILVSFPWTTGRQGSRLASAHFASTGAEGRAGDHGNIGTPDIHTTFLAWGAGIKSGIVSTVPVGNIDVAPTVLALMGLAQKNGIFDGRVAREVLEGGEEPASTPVETRVLVAENAGTTYRALLQMSSVCGSEYVDKAWREW